MKDSEIGLADLLANDSFLRWVKNEADRKVKKEWQQWMEEEEGRENIVKRAKKLAGLPFRKFDHKGLAAKELAEFKKKLKTDKSKRI